MFVYHDRQAGLLGDEFSKQGLPDKRLGDLIVDSPFGFTDSSPDFQQPGAYGIYLPAMSVFYFCFSNRLFEQIKTAHRPGN